MTLSIWDISIIVIFFIILSFISFKYTSEAGKNIDNYFVGGRSLPWYWAGLSMVATTFAADTPLAVNELVTQKGIAGNWLWWCFLAGGMLTTYFFARLWQRANIITEAELIEERYSGKAASFLRGFKGIYLGLIMNVVIIAWVNLAIMSLLQVFFNLDANTSFFYMMILLIFTAIYSSFSGLKGVVMSDAFQFIVAMVACITLAFIVVYSPEIGGMAALKERIIAEKGAEFLSFFPNVGSEADAQAASFGQTLTLSFGAFFAYIGVQWWASWYPGAEPGGGGYIAQRLASTRSGKDAQWASLFFQIVHYCLRPWPWIIVALCATVLYPLVGEDDATARLGYVYTMRDYLPNGLKGLLLGAFFAAYMSTISSQVNWGSSLIIKDVYQRFLRKEQKENNQDNEAKHYVLMARITTVLLALLGGFMTLQLDSIKGAWEIIMQGGAGLGLVLILRWYWKKINAWSEITAMIVPIIATVYFMYMNISFPDAFLYTVVITTVAWLLVTLLVNNQDAAHVERFWQKVHPYLYDKEKLAETKKYYTFAFISWIAATVLAYSVLFFIGKVLLMEYQEALYCFLIASVALITLKKTNFSI